MEGGAADTPNPNPAATPTAPPTPAVLRHGQTVVIAGDWGRPAVTQTFLGGATGTIETTAVGQRPANGGGWSFNNVGGPTSVALDARRGQVLFTPQDSSNYNATRRYDPGAPIPERRHFYKAHWVRNVLLLDGQPYRNSYQWKHERVHWANSIEDSTHEIKVHDWPQGGNGMQTMVNRGGGDGSTYYGAKARPETNGDWALMEMLVYTGTQGQNDGKLVTRVHDGGRTWVNQNRQTERIYADATRRLRYFVEQNYFGNWNQVEDRVDSAWPRPQVRELYSDDSRVIVGGDDTSGWQRVELRDQADLTAATVRELQAWTAWDGRIELTLNTGGLPAGLHDLVLVVISGVDANGLDLVQHSVPVRVQVG